MAASNQTPTTTDDDSGRSTARTGNGKMAYSSHLKGRESTDPPDGNVSNHMHAVSNEQVGKEANSSTHHTSVHSVDSKRENLGLVDLALPSTLKSVVSVPAWLGRQQLEHLHHRDNHHHHHRRSQKLRARRTAEYHGSDDSRSPPSSTVGYIRSLPASVASSTEDIRAAELIQPIISNARRTSQRRYQQQQQQEMPKDRFKSVNAALKSENQRAQFPHQQNRIDVQPLETFRTNENKIIHIVDLLRQQCREIVGRCTEHVASLGRKNMIVSKQFKSLKSAVENEKSIQREVLKTIETGNSTDLEEQQMEQKQEHEGMLMKYEDTSRGLLVEELVMLKKENKELRQQYEMTQKKLGAIEQRRRLDGMETAQKLSDVEHHLLGENCRLTVALTTTERRLKREIEKQKKQFVSELSPSNNIQSGFSDGAKRSDVSNPIDVENVETLRSQVLDTLQQMEAMENCLKQQIVGLVHEKFTSVALQRQADDMNAVLKTENDCLRATIEEYSKQENLSPRVESLNLEVEYVSSEVRRLTRVNELLQSKLRRLESVVLLKDQVLYDISRKIRRNMELSGDREIREQSADHNKTLELHTEYFDLELLENRFSELVSAVQSYTMSSTRVDVDTTKVQTDQALQQVSTDNKDDCTDKKKLHELQDLYTELSVNLQFSKKTARFYQDQFEKTLKQLEQVLEELGERTQLSDRLMGENAEYEVQLTTLKEHLVDVRAQLSDTHSQLTASQLLCKLTSSQVNMLEKAGDGLNHHKMAAHEHENYTEYDVELLKEIHGLEHDLQGCHKVIDELICTNSDLNSELQHLKDEADINMRLVSQLVGDKMAVEHKLQVMTSERNALDILRRHLDNEATLRQIDIDRLSTLLDLGKLNTKATSARKPPEI